MPSPFPGMDPYLEDPALWPDVHSRLINISSEFLVAQLRPKYFVQIDERLYVANEQDAARALIVPDLRVRESESHSQGSSRSATAAVIEADPGLEVEFDFEVHEGRLQIFDRDLKRIVTVVEFLSPANKTPGSAGFDAYHQKRGEVLSAGINLVEIDLLRRGEPLATFTNPAHHYAAHVFRWTGERHRHWVWPMPLPERLKKIPVPVRPEDKEAVLDLQALLNTAYDRAGYDLRVDYRALPHGPLDPQAQEWIRKVTHSVA